MSDAYESGAPVASVIFTPFQSSSPTLSMSAHACKSTLPALALSSAEGRITRYVAFHAAVGTAYAIDTGRDVIGESTSSSDVAASGSSRDPCGRRAVTVDGFSFGPSPSSTNTTVLST